jgi:hypothetical protein
MNLAQLRTSVRDILSAGLGMNTVIQDDTFWSNSEIDGFINKAQDEIYKAVRRAKADFFTRILRSTDSPFVVGSQLFDPSTLKWIPNQGNYQMPRDFVKMKLITDLTSDRVRILGSDIARNEFRILMTQEGGSTAREYLYDILGVGTIVYRPLPAEARDIEFIYIKSLPKLRDWDAGSISVTLDNNTATFTANAKIQDRLLVGDEVIVGPSATEQATADPGQDYPRIKSIDSSTQVTFERAYLGNTVSNFKYRASSVSEIPEHHHHLLIAYAASQCFSKGTNPHLECANLWRTEYNAMLPSLVNDVERRHESDIETVQAYLEDLYDA